MICIYLCLKQSLPPSAPFDALFMLKIYLTIAYRDCLTSKGALNILKTDSSGFAFDLCQIGDCTNVYCVFSVKHRNILNYCSNGDQSLLSYPSNMSTKVGYSLHQDVINVAVQVVLAHPQFPAAFSAMLFYLLCQQLSLL